MPEEKDERGYTWIRDLRYDEYYYLEDFENLVVTKVIDYSESLPSEHWEAIVYADDGCSHVSGKQEFKTKQEAQDCLERIMEASLKGKEK